MLEKYEAALDEKAAEHRRAAAEARSRADEREASLHLMCASMLGEMLKVLGRVEHEGRRGNLQKLADAAAARAEAARARGDYDMYDQERIKAATILWAKEQLEQLEKTEARHE